MTRSERSRPVVTRATFNMSTSNPDLSHLANSSPSSSDDNLTDDQEDSGMENFSRLSGGRSSLMEASSSSKHHHQIMQQASLPRKVFHEEIVLLFIVSNGHVKDLALQNAWFFFELLSKSMACHLQQQNFLHLPRQHRFPQRFHDDLQRLVHLVAIEICSRYTKDYDFTERLNCALAFLLNDLISVMDRGFVFQLLHVYCQQISEKMGSMLSTSPSSLLQLRVSLLRVVCSHEHYLTLNLPFALPPTPSSPTPSVTSNTSTFTTSATAKSAVRHFDLTDSFQRQHFLTGLLLSDIRLSIEFLEQGHSSMLKVQSYAICTLRNLLTSHDLDPRVNKSPELKRMVACLYLPLFSITLRALPYLFIFLDDEAGSGGDVEQISSSLASAISSPLPQLTNKTSRPSMSPESTRSLLVCFLWLLKNVEKSKLRTWWSSLAPCQLVSVLDILFVCVSCFELKYPGTSAFVRNDRLRGSLTGGGSKKTHMNQKSRLENVIRGEYGSARREMLMRRKAEKSAVGMAKEALRWNKNLTEWKQVKHGDRLRHMCEDSPASRLFSSESSLLVLDSLQLIVETSTELTHCEHNSATQQLLSCAIRVLLHLLSKRQGVAVLEHAFAIQRSLVAKFPELLFEEETEQCADLTLRLLEKCSSSVSRVRIHAAASLYMLMRHNYSIGNSFARVKMQVTMSMSSLVGVSHNFDEECLRRSLKTILTYAEKDAELEGTSFPEQVRDLVFNLHMILSDTVKMKEHQEDPEMLIDLMFRIAKGYQNSPDLRLTWLQNMARQHTERKNHAEAGMCYLHCASLVAEYLTMIEHKTYLPVGCASFEHVTCNVLEESAVSDDIISAHVDEICSEKFFSIQGLTTLLEQTVNSFTAGGLYEVVDMVYDTIIPIYQHQKNYKELSNIHAKLQESFTKISTQVGKRMFGTYFRVGFYGNKFGDLNGEQFVYKEPAITKLPEISHRLENFYTKCFGEGNVEVLKDSSNIEVGSLDPAKAYIQITYVEPFFYQYEEARKHTYFDRNYNMDKFMYATPFTKEGKKAHGEMKDQYKRKTFLQVSNTFPYVKTRINVIRKWEKVLTPLESACEDVRKKTCDLLRAVHLNPPDVRMLQVNLQGAVLTAVNQGPMEVANTFLTEIPDDPAQWIHYNEMRLAFKEFIHACSLALKKNKLLIGADQKEYQREMERNYHKMAEKLRSLTSDRTIILQMHKATNEELCI